MSQYTSRTKFWINPGVASQFVEHLDELPKDSNFILLCRVSERTQARNQHLLDQEEQLMDAVLCHKSKVLDAFHYVGPGWNTEWLEEPIELAQQTSSVLLAETTDRILRSHFYHPVHSPNAEPSVFEWGKLFSKLDGVTMATMISPTASPREVRSYQTKRGLLVNRRRPKTYKKELRDTLLPLLHRLREQGKSYQEISELIPQLSNGQRVTWVTVRNWLLRP